MNKSNKIQCVGLAFLLLLPVQFTAADDGNGDSIYTAWAFVFNHPEHCDGPCNAPDLGDSMVEGAVIYLTGQRVQSNGRAIFAGAISANSNHRQIGGSSIMGLVAPLTAEIHIGLQNHQKSSLEGDAAARHNQVTNPCGPPCAIEQFATFLPAMSVGTVADAADSSPVADASATMTRSPTGVSISIDTRL